MRSADHPKAVSKLYMPVSSEGQAGQVKSMETRLRASPLTQEAKNLLVAELYESYGLHAEALELLSSLLKDYPSPAVWLMTGSVHLESGLPEQAIQAYNEALVLAESIGDISSAGEAHLGLALAQKALGDEDLAAASMQNGERLLKEVGAIQRLREVEAILGGN